MLQPIDIGAMTRDIASLFHGAATEAGVILTVDCPTLPQAVYVDRLQWEQVVINLLGNAIKFTPSGDVRISLRAQVGLMTLEVAYTGEGIQPEDLPHVFERFGRTADREDSGLGLALVRELVRLHGGDVEATSTPGQGSRFRVCIPMLGNPARTVPHRRVADLPRRTTRTRPADAVGWMASPSPPTPVETAAPPAVRERIVLMIDRRELREYVGGLLRPYYRVQTLASGADALGAIAEREPDLVLVDRGSVTGDSLAFIVACARPRVVRWCRR